MLRSLLTPFKNASRGFQAACWNGSSGTEVKLCTPSWLRVGPETGFKKDNKQALKKALMLGSLSGPFSGSILGSFWTVLGLGVILGSTWSVFLVCWPCFAYAFYCLFIVFSIGFPLLFIVFFSLFQKSMKIRSQEPSILYTMYSNFS